MVEWSDMVRTGSAHEVDNDEIVAGLLEETSHGLKSAAVHKTTLVALLAAASEDPDAPVLLEPVLRRPSTSLNDALLMLRRDGRVELTPDGFILTSAGRAAASHGSPPAVAEFLRRLVGRKLSEWKLVSTVR